MGYEWETYDRGQNIKPIDPRNKATWDRATRTWRDSSGNVVGDDPVDWFIASKEYFRRKGRKIAHDLDLDRHLEVQYNPGLVNKYFSRASQKGNYEKPIVTLDIETDDNNRPITISAIKTARNLQTGEFEVIDVYQRFYKAKGRDLVHTYEVHGLSPSNLNKLRRKQGASYQYTYTNVEASALKQFIGDSVIAGHNVIGFDLKHLFPGGVGQNQVIDTWHASVNAFGKINPVADGSVHNDLDSVFQRLFGKTMAQAGLPHHDAMADSIATALITNKLLISKDTRVGSELNLMMRNPSLMYGPEESLLVNRGNTEIRTGLFKGLYDFFDREDGRDYYYGGLDELMKSSPELFNKDGSLKDVLDNTKFEQMLIEGGMGSMDAVMAKTLLANIKEIRRNMGVIQQVGSDISGFGNTLSTYKRADWIRTLSSVIDLNDDYAYKTMAEGLNMPTTDVPNIVEAAKVLRQNKNASTSFKNDFRELRKYYRNGMWGTDYVEGLRKGLSQSSSWDEHSIEALERDKKYAYNVLRDKAKAAGVSEEEWDKMSSLSTSYDDLASATDALIKKNNELLNIYQAIANIKFYDPNQYYNSARGQASGILSAARGVVPNTFLGPISRLTDASFNMQAGFLSKHNAFMNIWNSGIGNAAMAGAGAIGGAIGTALLPGVGTLVGAGIGTGVGGLIKGGVAGVTQIVGNVKQSRMEQAGYALQNSLNTIGAITEWVTTPFKLLGKVTKTLIGSFSGLSIKIKNIMGSGIDSMSQMGNPLTELTGIGYTAYQGSNMIDIAGLMGKGTMNSTYEDFVNQAKALYTTGSLNTSRVVAASMLGIFDQVYNANANGGTYNDMVNRLLTKMSTQSEAEKVQTMYLASQIDKNLPGLLTTANLMGVTDINTLTDPTRRGMYWRPISDDEASTFRWTQYEYGAAKEQWNNSRMRWANKIWGTVGKPMFNGINKLADGDVTGFLSSFNEAWASLKETLSSVWDTIKQSDMWSDMAKGFGNFVKQLEHVGLDIAQGIITIWDNIMVHLVNKAQGLIAYLGSISFKPHYDKDTGFSFEFVNKTQAEAEANMKTFDERAAANARNYKRAANRGEFYGPMAEDGTYGRDLYKLLFPNATTEQMYTATTGDIRNALISRISNNEARNMISVGGKSFRLRSLSDVDEVMTYAFQNAHDAKNLDSAWFQAYGSKTTLGEYSGELPGLARAFVGGSEDLLNPVFGALHSAVDKQVIELDFRLNDKLTAKTVFEDGNIVHQEGMTMLRDLVSRALSLVVEKTR